MSSASSPLSPALPDFRTSWALFLDVDGTILDIAETPGAVIVSAGLLGLLEAVERRLGGALALVSGRSLEDLDRLFAPLVLPAAGLHGLELRRDAGHVRPPPALPDVGDLRARLAAFVAHTPGTLLEDKGGTLAVHFRRAPRAEETVRTFVRDLVAHADEPLEVQEGKCVLEIRPAGADKGAAIEALLSCSPFRGRLPVFVGDDLTDESGFEAVNRRGGHSIRVGRNASSQATYRLDGVAAVHRWLAKIAGREREGAERA